MKATLIVETCFGNTARVAGAMADGLRKAGVGVAVTPVSEAAARVATDLLILAAPTHNMGMSSASSRAQAAHKGAEQVPEAGMREWIEAVQSIKGRVVTVSTMTGGRFTGSAAKAMQKALKRHGIRAERGEDFVVGGTPGPLADGELERARGWARGLGRRRGRASS